MRSPVRSAIFATVLGLAAGSSMAVEAVRIDDKFNTATMAPALFKAQSDGNKTVRGLLRVAIGTFDVEFVTRGSSSASESWLTPAGLNTTRPNGNSVMSLSGVSEADMQAIVDQVHARFVRELRATGLDVVPTSQVMNTNTFRKMADTGKPAPHHKHGGQDAATVVTAEGRPVSGASLVPRGSSAIEGFSAVAGSLITGHELAEETEATIINVRMVVRFVEQASGNASLLSRVVGAAPEDTKLSPVVVAGDTKVHIFTAQGGGSFTLQVPLQVDPSAFTGVKDRMSPGSKATGVGLAVLSFALGKNDSGSLTQFEALADPQRYRELVGTGLGRVGSMMVEQIKTLRHGVK